MHILNYYFTPFAVILIAFAIFFSEPERGVTYASFGLLAAAFGLNYWMSSNVYQLMRFTRSIRGIIVWINLITSAALFYLLSPYWAPMWLLFLTAPAASAMFMKKWQVFLTALSAAAMMLGIYYLRSVIYGIGLSTQLLGMAATQAVFIVFFSMFTAAMTEMTVKVRDSLR
ncbi:MAG: hypothetical protein A2X34_06060 [Elusimicrobia bacterium GWC2_51_8]|nr:MAG: hypothetical protein A2X33_04900 [Elusimicrobia bacterium GWA2_51_34]OGR59004.1 MAG: hypothetical protein A2X34_06060 [Elusimicrobia bacterium GWC2_51_8]HAF95663.1 hypothetical protein [Elusimicrobiota bacterium]HCE97430.1 hypothetical protein [Elusimicrobiota bacterium]